MKVILESEDGTEKATVDSTEIPDLNSLKEKTLTKRKIIRFIENTNMSADLKAQLVSMTNSAVRVGKILLPIGRAVLSAVIELIKLFPTVTFSLILVKFLPLLASAWMVKVGLIKLIGATLPLAGAYVDTKNLIDGNKISEAAERVASRFFPSAEVNV